MIGWCLTAFAAIIPEEPPREGVQTVLAVTNADGSPRSGETVRVIHRPDLTGEQEIAIGITDGRGRVRWTPETWGIARLRAGEETAPVRIARRAVDPTEGLVLALLLATGAGAVGLGWRGRP